ncbi:hypothetical protein KC19_3G149300 [Ceratodon purpureus]|uniref:Uncharacterized protein n=1 Tax=Ceratodon purpureus TaxID=3225 RepID=A0A8T0IKQ9_CERPU|nr:hypothetical protein KC19_3G149300 [Ceratodon purpureus]
MNSISTRKTEGRLTRWRRCRGGEGHDERWRWRWTAALGFASFLPSFLANDGTAPALPLPLTSKLWASREPSQKLTPTLSLSPPGPSLAQPKFPSFPLPALYVAVLGKLSGPARCE